MGVSGTPGNEPGTPGREDPQPGDRFWFEGYGNGVVESVGPLRIWIKWEKAGRLDHDRSFVRHLQPPK